MRTSPPSLNPQTFKVTVLKENYTQDLCAIVIRFLVRKSAAKKLVFEFLLCWKIKGGGIEMMGGRKFGMETRQSRRALGVISHNVVGGGHPYPYVVNKRGLSE